MFISFISYYWPNQLVTELVSFLFFPFQCFFRVVLKAITIWTNAGKTRSPPPSLSLCVCETMGKQNNFWAEVEVALRASDLHLQRCWTIGFQSQARKRDLLEMLHHLLQHPWPIYHNNRAPLQCQHTHTHTYSQSNPDVVVQMGNGFFESDRARRYLSSNVEKGPRIGTMARGVVRDPPKQCQYYKTNDKRK